MIELKCKQAQAEREVKDELTKNSRRPSKRWLLARKIPHGLQGKNDVIEISYKAILKAVKKHLKTLPDEAGKAVFERDYRHDITESPTAMHTFLTDGFYWHLECTYTYVYNVRYCFYKCKYEQLIQAMIQEMMPYKENLLNEEKDFATFYKRVLEVQDKQYIYSLYANDSK